MNIVKAIQAAGQAMTTSDQVTITESETVAAGTAS